MAHGFESRSLREIEEIFVYGDDRDTAADDRDRREASALRRRLLGTPAPRPSLREQLLALDAKG